jgi:hypothetical protein
MGANRLGLSLPSIDPTAGVYPPIRCLSKRYATSWAYISIRRTEKQLELARTRNWAAAGFDEVVRDAARHSFCSYHLAFHGDLNKALLTSGHTTTRVLWTNYYQHATEETARTFWSIMPPETPANAITHRHSS